MSNSLGPVARGAAKQRLPWWMIVVAGMALLVVIYVGFRFVLGNVTDPLVQRLQNIGQTSAPVAPR